MARHLAAATGDGASLASAPPVDRTGFLVVIGLGLGLHVAELIQRTNPRHVLLVEPLHEFLRHSLEATDWQDVLEDCRAHRRTVDFVVEAELTEIVERLHELIEAYGPCQLDGSHVYLHYRTPVTELVRRQFEELAGTKMILKGYYRDEVRMVQNTIDNVQGADVSLIAGGLRPPRSEPAIIVGSGPSIDTAVGAIERWSGHAVIFSAGSSLQVLLEHGIVPDFHVENENSQISVERLQFIVDRFADRFPRGRFDGIRLVASTTVQPAVLGLFPERSLFFRNGLSAADMFGRGSRPLDGTGPFSANAALTLAAVLGFRDVYLFGCDCGAKTAADHHSRHTVYYTRAETMARAPVDLPLAAAGNFGGQVLVNSYFVDSRQMFEAVIAAVDLEVRNGSDGALIDGAMPMDPSDMAIATAPLDKAAVVADIRAAGEHFAPRCLPRPRPPGAARRRVAPLLRRLQGRHRCRRPHHRGLRPPHPRFSLARRGRLWRRRPHGRRLGPRHVLCRRLLPQSDHRRGRAGGAVRRIPCRIPTPARCRVCRRRRPVRPRRGPTAATGARGRLTPPTTPPAPLPAHDLARVGGPMRGCRPCAAISASASPASARR